MQYAPPPGSTAGTLVLIPVPIADGALDGIPPEVRAWTQTLRNYCVENLRTARRALRALHPTLPIDDTQFSEIDKHAGPDLQTLKAWLGAGLAVGVMSEAGCPGVADPGAELVSIAHQLGARVIPLTGPSSILLALMASGMNGQRFAFQGYLPQKSPECGQRIVALEAASRREQQTQIFIETPYRNAALLDDLLKACSPETLLCIAQAIGGPHESIRTQAVRAWKANRPVLQKEPAVFCLLAK